MNLSITKKFINKNDRSRPGLKMKKIMALIVHWTQSPGAKATWVADFFEKRNEGYGGAHYVIDIDGSVINCIPDNEVAWHCGAKSYTDTALAFFGAYTCSEFSSPNFHSIGLELCHETMRGDFSESTLNSTKILLASLCEKYSLNAKKDILRHYDITGKICPKWFVNKQDEWENFLNSVLELQNTKNGQPIEFKMILGG